MTLRAAVLLYPGAIAFEVMLAAQTLAERGVRVGWFTLDGAPIAASVGARIAADGAFADVTRDPPHAVLVPGGDPGSVVPDDAAGPALRAADAAGSVVAGICAGCLVLAAAGVLRGRRGTHNYTAEFAPSEAVEATAPFWAGMHHVRADVVVDDRLVTAQPWADRDFAAAVARLVGVMSADEADAFVAYPSRRRLQPSP